MVPSADSQGIGFLPIDVHCAALRIERFGTRTFARKLSRKIASGHSGASASPNCSILDCHGHLGYVQTIEWAGKE
jgi:hypothetical protein